MSRFVTSLNGQRRSNAAAISWAAQKRPISFVRSRSRSPSRRRGRRRENIWPRTYRKLSARSFSVIRACGDTPHSMGDDTPNHPDNTLWILTEVYYPEEISTGYYLT